ncbi:lamin tail domain-containing protein [Algivirga pacifica]|uniref:lamin tail domain-containing protein n=1 Tax=Algivirga pacifica TaxID=1162670 RepID=UPI0031E79291
MNKLFTRCEQLSTFESSLIISEIFFDPTPSKGLPEAEFLELYNRGEKSIQLSEYILWIDQKEASLPTYHLPPKSYLILCKSSEQSLWSKYGEVASPSKWNALKNTGATLTLKRGEKTVFSFHYNPKNFSTELQQGGISLEIIDPSACITDINWNGSIEAIGGTPGTKNSIHGVLDETIEIQDIQLTTPNTLSVQLNQPIQITSALSIDSAHPVDSIIQEQQIIYITFENPLKQSIPYQLHLNNIQTCSGEFTTLSIHWINPLEANTQDILLSEILFNPVKDAVDFIECFNPTMHYLQLSGWSIVNNKEVEVVIPRHTLAIAPKSYFILTSSEETLRNTHQNIPDSCLIIEFSLPAFYDEEGSVILKKGDSIAQHFAYQDDFHYPLLQNTEGVSLERIDFRESENDPSNWRSAAATIDFATPGETNSQQGNRSTPSDECVHAYPTVFTPGNNGIDDYVRIELPCLPTGSTINAKVFDRWGYEVAIIANNINAGSSATLRWDGQDQNQQLVTVGPYIVWIEAFNLQGVLKRWTTKVIVSYP